MRVGIIVLYESSKSRLLDIASGLAEGVMRNGHTADIVDGVLESDKKVSYYDYLIVGCEAAGFFGGKIPDRCRTYLAQCGTVSGKRSFAFVLKKGLRTGKTLKALMKQMEIEGMFLKYSEVLKTKAEGQEIGRRLHI